ncbi:ATP-binding protein [Kitasatospora sp. NPDC057692]|uniref:ATP-binding protein n=1 Tax=Kitasatospora sp. NPDC057692 TaxID=3346215 RepID=UPI00369FB692
MARALLRAHALPRPGSAPGLPVVEISLPYLPESAAQARRFLRETLAGWGLDHVIDVGVLVASELVTNAAKTGCRQRMTVTVRFLSHATLRISVRDGSCVLPVLIRASPEEECHRGLVLVDRLTGGRWGATVEPAGKVVHADLTIVR